MNAEWYSSCMYIWQSHERDCMKEEQQEPWPLLPSLVPTPMVTIHHSLLPFSSFTTMLHHSLLPFIFHYYPSSFTTTLFIIHYYASSFTTTLHHSLPFSIHYYPSSVTTAFIIQYYHSPLHVLSFLTVCGF